MKSLNQLTLEDLKGAPVWRYVGESDADARVEPTELSSISEYSAGVFLVRATFTLNDGSVLGGYCSPADSSGLDYVQPVIILDGDHVPLFLESPPQDAEPETTCVRLGRPHGDIFPLHFRAEIPVDGSFVVGVVHTIQSSGSGTI